MDVNEAITEETPDLERRVNDLQGTMTNLAANLGAVDEQTRANTGTLAEQTVMLQGILRSLQMLSNDVLPNMHDKKGAGKKDHVYVPPTVEISEKLILTSWSMEHVSARIPSIEYELGRYPEASEPVKATKLISEGLHTELLRELASGRFVNYGMTYGNGPEEWNNLNDLDFQSLKSMLIIMGRPKSVHQAALKIKEIRIGISEHSLAKSMLFSIDERLLALRKYLEDLKIFHDTYFPPTVPMWSKKDGLLQYYPLESHFPPIYKQGDTRENPQSLLKMVEQTVVYDRKILNKVMFDSIFCSLSKGDPFHKVLLGVINDVVYEAAAQSGNAETVEALEKARRKSIAQPIGDLEVPEDDSVAASEENFDVKNMFNKALQIKEGDPGHLQRLYVSPSDTSTSWWHGFLNVGMYNIRVIQKFNGSSKELWSRMFERSSVPKRQEVHAITAQDLEHIAATELLDGDNSAYGNQASLCFIADQLTEAGQIAVEKEELQQQVQRLNALHPVKIDNRWSNSKPGEKRLPCYRAAHFGRCDKGDSCRFSHRESDLADLKQDPRYKEWKSKLSAEDGARFHALECDNANLQQEVNHQADLLFR